MFKTFPPDVPAGAEAFFDELELDELELEEDDDDEDEELELEPDSFLAHPAKTNAATERTRAALQIFFILFLHRYEND